MAGSPEPPLCLQATGGYILMPPDQPGEGESLLSSVVRLLPLVSTCWTLFQRFSKYTASCQGLDVVSPQALCDAGKLAGTWQDRGSRHLVG